MTCEDNLIKDGACLVFDAHLAGTSMLCSIFSQCGNRVLMITLAVADSKLTSFGGWAGIVAKLGDHLGVEVSFQYVVDDCHCFAQILDVRDGDLFRTRVSEGGGDFDQEDAIPVLRISNRQGAMGGNFINKIGN